MTRARKPELVGPVYLDASALAKLYLPEPESEVLDRALTGRRDLVVSDLAVTEVVSAAARRRREGVLTAAEAARLRVRLLKDLDEGLFVIAAIDRHTHRAAEQILLETGVPLLRTLDALHLALAADADTRTVATWDRRLAEAAIASGMNVFP